MSVIRYSAISAVNDPAQSSFSSSEVIAGKSVFSRGLRTFTALKRFTEIDANILVKITPPPSPLIVIPSISSKM